MADYFSLPPQSNEATFQVVFSFIEADTGEAIDITNDTITASIVDDCDEVKIACTVANGRIEITDATEGEYAVVVSADDMGVLMPGDYQLFVKHVSNTDTLQTAICDFQIYQGYPK